MTAPAPRLSRGQRVLRIGLSWLALMAILVAGAMLLGGLARLAVVAFRFGWGA